MLDLIKVDIYKMAKSSLIKIVFVLSVLSAGLMFLFAHLMATGDMDIQNTGIMSLFADSQIFSLLGCVIIGMFLCNDFEYKIIENAISSGHKRNTIVFSKMLSLVILIAIISLPYIIAIILSVCTNLEMIVYMPTAYLTIVNFAIKGTDMMNIIVFIILAILTYSAKLSIGIFIMFLVKKPVIVIALSYITILLLGPVLGLNEVTKNIMAYTPFGIDYTGLAVNFELVNLMKSCAIGVIFILIFTFLSILVFRKCEVK